MSQGLRKWLLIGGSVIIGLLVVVCLALFIFSRAGGGLSGAAAPELINARQPASQKVGFAGASDAAVYPTEAAGAGGAESGIAPLPVEQAPAQPAPTSQTQGNTEGQQIQRLIIRNGNITVSVSNTYDARNKILGLVSQMSGDGAFVVSVNESGGGGDVSPYINMVIRVPAANFSQTMDNIAGMAAKGTTPQRSETAQDVTDQYVDVKSRLASMEAARDRLQQIMSSAQNTNDLLQAEQLLTQREADIEALKGRMQYLEQSAALSEITISLQPYILSQPVDTSWNPGETFRHAIDQLLNDLRGFADFLITFLVAVLPWLVVVGAIGYGIYRFVRSRIRRNRANQGAAMTQEEA